MSKAIPYKSWMSNALPYAIGVVVIGGALGYLVNNGTLGLAQESLAASLALGLACGYVIIQLIDALRQGLAIGADPIPESLDVGDRAAVGAAVGNAGGSGIGTRAAHLLNAWSAGWDPRSVTGLASYQAQQGRQAAYLSAVVPLALLAAAVWQGADATLVVIGFIGTALAVQARLSANRQADYYLEQRLLSRLPGNLPNATMTTDELSAAIGDAIEGTFKQYMASPEDIATALGKSADAIVREATGNLQNVGRALEAISTEMTGGLKEGSSTLKSALAEHATALKSSGGDWGGQIQGVLSNHNQGIVSALGDHNQGIVKALGDHNQGIVKALGDHTTQIDGVLGNHTKLIESATGNLSEQLDKIARLQTDMEKVLHVQEVVDGTLKTVAATEEFKDTIVSLRKHVEESDVLLREVAKPRTIRLVEEDID